jgi:lipopolysaccharide transport system permease protein
VGFVEGVRWSTLGVSALNAPMLIMSVVISSVIFIGGAFFFRRVERSFADVI